MENTKTLKPTDKVYVWTGHSYIIGTVTKVTPKGLVDVVWGTDTPTTPTRFNAQGKEVGSKYSRCELDNASFEYRTALIAQEQRARVAAGAMMKIARADQTVRAQWGKEYMTHELDRLQALIRDAREAVAAI